MKYFLASSLKSGLIPYWYPNYLCGSPFISYKQNNRIHIELTAESPGILVLSESSYPGWQVFVDGEEKECLWLNLLFQGVEVEKGKHNIEFVYRPKYFSLFSTISLVSLIIFVFIWFYYSLSVRKKVCSSN
ncbi:YfhO family protein [Thermodesulfobacteriota bacterium]